MFNSELLNYPQTPRFPHTLLVLGRSTKVLGNIKVPPPLNFTFILHSLKIFNKGGFNSSTPGQLLHSLKAFNKGGFNSSTPGQLLHSLKAFNKGGFNSSTPVKLLHSLKIFNNSLILPPGLHFYIR